MTSLAPLAAEIFSKTSPMVASSIRRLMGLSSARWRVPTPCAAAGAAATATAARTAPTHICFAIVIRVSPM